jgi:predicted nucleic acid-binding protein
VAEVFADTSGWAAAFVPTDSFHPKARTFIRGWQASKTRIVTTNYVLVELAALLTSPLRISHIRRVQIIDTIRSASWVNIIHIDPALDADAWTLLKARPDKDWSLVDCASFAVMADRGIAEALTSDHHFEQAGFVRLLN